MKTCLRPVVAALVLAGVVGISLSSKPLVAEEKKPAARAWTLEEAKAELALHPKDSYLQYVVLQLARRDKKLQENAEWLDRVVNPNSWRGPDRRNQVDMFSVFTGALAVQESLQLDTMRGDGRRRGPRFATAVPPGADAKEVLEKRRKEVVEIHTLTGPTIKSHPWKQMLGDKKPEISPLAKYVPEDFYFIEFRSLNKLIDAMELNDQWGTHLFNQSNRDARTQNSGERLKKQLAVETNKLLKPFYDVVVQEVAIAGSDLFLREGSDVTMIFQAKQPEVLKARMDGFLANAEKSPNVKKSTGEIAGVPYVHLASPDRDVHVYSAYPAKNLHVRSNSKPAFESILTTITGRNREGNVVRTLGDSLEFAYIRTLMPRGAAEEDGFVYLSDPFIRKLVGPQVKLTERRRMLCYNHLRMIGHASLMHRTEFGNLPNSTEDLVKGQCAPGMFGDGDLACPDGGSYSLSKDGASGICSHHGHARFMTPCAEIPLDKVNGEEADEYKFFLNEYNQYWRTFFDPIGIRIQITPERYRLETIILPLIDNSIYSGMAMAFGGKPEALDSLPVPKRNIFSVNVRLDKEKWLAPARDLERNLKDELLRQLGIRNHDAKDLNVTEFLEKGVGNQIGLHVYDAEPTFDFNLPSFIGETMGTFNGRGNMIRSPEFLLVSFVVTSLNSPVYIAVPVKDEKVVDKFLEGLDSLFAIMARQPTSGGWFSVEQDYYKVEEKNGEKKEVKGMRCNSVGIGPFKFRMFWGRIGKGLYIASKPFILEDLQAAEAAQKEKKDKGPEGHAMLRMRPENWDQVLNNFRLGWAENNRQACINNLGPMTSVARAFSSPKGEELSESELSKRSAAIAKQADLLHGVHFFCPDGGAYVLSPEGRVMGCTTHGWTRSPRQPSAPVDNGAMGKLLQQFSGMTATLTFLEDGLHAVALIERK